MQVFDKVLYDAGTTGVIKNATDFWGRDSKLMKRIEHVYVLISYPRHVASVASAKQQIFRALDVPKPCDRLTFTCTAKFPYNLFHGFSAHVYP